MIYFLFLFLTFLQLQAAAFEVDLSEYSKDNFIPLEVLQKAGKDPFACDFPKVYLSKESLEVASPEVLFNGFMRDDCSVRELHIRISEGGDIMAQILAGVLHKCPITFLWFNNCFLTDQGALLLAKALPNSQLKSLFLEGGNISDQGFALLIDGIVLSKLETLSLAKNLLSPNKWNLCKFLLPSKTMTQITL